MLIIDGSQGEGGGQIFRSALTLAMCLGRAVRINNIRAGRAKPGLLRQHLSCLRAAQAICSAEVGGNELASREVVFKPGAVAAGRYQFAVGSAGSSSLVFQTVCLPLMFAQGPSELLLQGGTHNGAAPSYDFIEQCWLPAVAEMGYRAACQLQHFGFYPAGGGAWTARLLPLDPSLLAPLQRLQRGAVTRRLAVATSAQIAEHVTQRELHQVQQHLNWLPAECQQRLVKSVGPGNILSLRVFCERSSEMVEVVGEKKLSAERVAARACQLLQGYLMTDAAVGEALADQLLLPMALARGGEFTTTEPSEHLRTNMAVINQFMGPVVSLRRDQQAENTWRVQVAPRRTVAG